MKYLFQQPLTQALIKSRPNRFIMLVQINNKIEKCHCPSTGRIGNIEFTDIPCLLSTSNNDSRKTDYTVEAISPKKGLWIGINQTKANSYIEFFLKNNMLPNIIKVKDIRREVKSNNSKIDFLINDECFIEVKTPLRHLPFGNKTDNPKFTSFDRLVKHFTEISLNNRRSVGLLCYLYDAEPFKPPKNPNKEILKAVKGVENWQINLKIDKKGVALLKYFKLNLK